MKRFKLKLRSNKSTRLSALKNCPLPAACCLLLSACLLLFGCQSRQPEASADALTAPLPTPQPPATPQPSIDPRVTDLERVKEGAPAPDFALEDTEGKLYRLSDYKGKKYVVLVFYRGYF